MRQKKRLLFIGEGVTLSHIVRPLALAKALNPHDYEIFYACDPAYRKMVENAGIVWMDLPCLPSKEFLKRLAQGAPLFTYQQLKGEVHDDIALFAKINPDVVIGDFRVSLSISATFKEIPYICLVNVYWSPFSSLIMPFPELPIIKFTGVALGHFIFKCISMFALIFHVKPFQKVQREFGLPVVKSLRKMYTSGDATLYLDLPSLVPMYSFPKNHQYLGPVFDIPDIPRPDWWGKWPEGKPIVYVSLGSSGDIRLLDLLKDTLKEMDLTVLLTTAGRFQNENFPDNFYVADYLSGLEIANVARLFIVNGGSGSIYQALSHGIPVLGFPSNMDQFFLMERLTKLGAGILIRPSRAESNVMRESIKILLENESYRKVASGLGEHVRLFDTKQRFRDFISRFLDISTREDPPVLADFVHEEIDRQELLEILKVGVRAVSPYNLQPWEFRYVNRQLLIYPKYHRRGFLISPRDVVLYSIGALLENLSEGAKSRHYEMRYHLMNLEMDTDNAVCVVGFKKSNSTQEYDIDHVMKRYTNRKIYKNKPVPAHLFVKIQELFRGEHRQVFDLTNNTTIIDTYAELEKVRIASYEFNEEIHDILCTTPRQAEEVRRGLDLRVLEMPFYARWFLWAQQNPYFHRAFARGRLPQEVAAASKKKALYGCALLIAFIDHDNSAAATVNAWRDIQKVLNYLHKEGLSAQLIGASPDVVQNKRAFYIPEQRKVMEEAEKKIQKFLGVDLNSTMTLLRIGYADDCRYRTLRVDPEKLLLP